MSWHTHVYTSTYTADVSGVCSVMYELKGMTILHDPSGCNSTYTTHDEPRWYDSKSLMYVSGLDEMDAIFGDDQTVIDDTIRAAKELKPRFITLCGASIPHIIAFDFNGVSRLIENETGIPVIPVATDGLKSYVSGVGLATRQWIKRFADLSLSSKKGYVNLLGVTPIDFANDENVEALKEEVVRSGYTVNACFARNDSFENLEKIPQAEINLVPSSAGRIPARFLYGKKRIPWVEGLPVGPYMAERVKQALDEAQESGQNQTAYDTENPDGQILIIGEEIYARSLATDINHRITDGRRASAIWPDITEGLNEDELIARIKKADTVICDPLFKTVIPKDTPLIAIPHVGYSGRIFLDSIPVFACRKFNILEKI